MTEEVSWLKIQRDQGRCGKPETGIMTGQSSLTYTLNDITSQEIVK